MHRHEREARPADAGLRKLTPAWRGRLAIIGAAFIFGSTFVVVQDAVEDLTPTAFLAARFGIAAIVLIPFIRGSSPAPGVAQMGGPGVVVGGIAAGAVLGVGYLFQTAGLQFTSATNSAFITGLLVAFTPLLAAVFLHRRLTATTLAGVAVALVGLFALTGGIDDFGRGDVLTVGCAVAFAGHVILLDVYASRFGLVGFTAVQMAVVAIGSALLVPFTGIGRLTPTAVAAIVFTGVFASAVAFWLQAFGQRFVGPSRTALLLLLEPVFAGILGYLVGDRLGVGGVVGAVLILAGTGLAEIGAMRRGVIPAPDST
ncbi:MAG: DMT family transporter [Acidimicrobiia bacterium]|nr:DMT family transporter [Acidimicrobiia bacterium]